MKQDLKTLAFKDSSVKRKKILSVTVSAKKIYNSRNNPFEILLQNCMLL